VAAAVLLLARLPVAKEAPALTALGVVAAVCVGLIVYEVVRHRESRAWIRGRRGEFSIEEALRLESSRRGDRHRRRKDSHG
jgi:hypothetical protein